MIYDKLYAFQKNVVDKFKDRTSYGLFLDMGLGKTPTSLAFAEVNECNKLIIVSVNSKVTESETEHGSWLWWIKQMKLTYDFTIKTEDCKHSKNEILLINYEALFKRNSRQLQLRDNIVEFINSCKGQNVAFILDESHKLKNLQSIQTKAIIKIQTLLKHTCNLKTYLLTGTPFTTGYIDLYSQLKLLGMQMNKEQFIDTFCVRGNLPGLLGWQQPIVGYKNVKLLFDEIHRYAITIDSEDVIELPEKVFVEHTYPQTQTMLALSLEQAYPKSITRWAMDFEAIVPKYDKPVLQNNPFYRNLAYPEFKWAADTSGTFWLRARQAAIGFQGNAEDSKWYDTTRLSMFEDFLSDNEDNYVLFYNFTPELLAIYEICEKLDYKIDIYSGEIKSMHYYDEYSNMNESEKLVNKKRIIISNFASGSTGKNWQEYNKCIIFSLPVYKDYAQGIKRINRIGQKQTTIYHIFRQQCWLDNGMKESLDQCKDYNTDLFDADLLRLQNLMNKM